MSLVGCILEQPWKGQERAAKKKTEDSRSSSNELWVQCSI